MRRAHPLILQETRLSWRQDFSQERSGGGTPLKSIFQLLKRNKGAKPTSLKTKLLLTPEQICGPAIGQGRTNPRLRSRESAKEYLQDEKKLHTDLYDELPLRSSPAIPGLEKEI